MGGQGCDVQVLDRGLLCCQRRQLMEVSGKQTEAANVGGNVLADGPGQTEAIVCGRASAKLVDYDEGVSRGRAGGASTDDEKNLFSEAVNEPVCRLLTAEWQPSPASLT